METCAEDNQPVAPLRLAGTEAEPGQAILGKKPRKVGRRACDGCIVRKVKCSATTPCVRCVKVGIVCTFNRQPRKRGPHQLRDKTIQEIRDVQSRSQSQPQSQLPRGEQPRDSVAAASGPNSNGDCAAAVAENRHDVRTVPVQALIARLCIYRVRLFPVWPIVAVDEVVAALHDKPEDLESLALANAIGAATVAQLRLASANVTEAHDTATASAMEAECERVKARLQRSAIGTSMNLNALRIAFFLHIYHENQIPGGPRSLLYLREAITVAQIMGLHREHSYSLLSASEQHARRRAIWLLFVTERGVAMLHKLPLVLKWDAAFPSLDISVSGDESYVFPAFRHLAHLFWMFDQSGIFDLIGGSGAQLSGGPDYGAAGTSLSAIQQGLLLLLQQLQARLSEPESSSDVQKADICITRLWMQAVTWKMLMGLSDCQPVNKTSPEAIYHEPLEIAKDLLVFIAGLPEAAIEAHGPAIEFKIFGIASSVIDSMTSTTSRSALDHYITNSNDSSSFQSIHPGSRHVLLGLQRLLASCRRGGNQMLLDMLQAKMTSINEQGGGRVNNGNITLLTESLGRRLLLSVSEKEDWRMNEGGEQEAESWSLEKLVDSVSGSVYSSHCLVPWPLAPSPWGNCDCQTEFHQALCSALDFASFGMTVQGGDAHANGMLVDGVVEQESDAPWWPRTGTRGR